MFQCINPISILHCCFLVCAMCGYEFIRVEPPTWPCPPLPQCALEGNPTPVLSGLFCAGVNRLLLSCAASPETAVSRHLSFSPVKPASDVPQKKLNVLLLFRSKLSHDELDLVQDVGHRLHLTGTDHPSTVRYDAALQESLCCNVSLQVGSSRTVHHHLSALGCDPPWSSRYLVTFLMEVLIIMSMTFRSL